MPCRDYYDDHPEAYFRDVTEPALKKQISFAESALCGALTALERLVNVWNTEFCTTHNALNEIDYESIGIKKRELISWWENHKKLDETHRKEELRKAALAKLSKEEKDALGVG